MQRPAPLRGESREAINVGPGDVVVFPAGTGHPCITQTGDPVVVSAYPSSGTYNLCRGSKAEHTKALVSIPKVPRPEADPVFGRQGPLIALGHS